GQFAAAVFVPPPEFIMTSFFDVRDVSRGAFPEIPIEPIRDRRRFERATDRVVADARFHSVYLADPTVANELACQPVASVRSLLASSLKHPLVLAGGREHRLAFLDRQR